MQGLWEPMEQQAVESRLALAIVGDASEVRQQLQRTVDSLGIDEVLAVTDTYDQTDRLRSYEILSEVAQSIRLPHAMAA